MDDHKAQSPFFRTHWLSQRVVRLEFAVYWVHCWSERSTMRTELSCSRHILPRKEKVVKTCFFPAACGLPTGSGAECQHQPHSAFGSVKMLFTKVKHIASSGVKGALWQKRGPGSGWTELGFGFCKPATVTDPLERLPLVNPSFFHPEPQGSSLSCWITAKHLNFFSLYRLMFKLLTSK